MAKKQMAFTFTGSRQACSCGRCGTPCKVDPVPHSKATMLKKADVPKGLCVNCAVHDQLRHLYPANLILARSGPKGLVLPQLQQQFFEICQLAGTDARFEEIDWNAVIANWDLPFPTKLKSTATNPVTQEDLDRERVEGDGRRTERWKPPLSEQERRAKYEAEIDEAMRNVIDCVRRQNEDSPTDHGAAK